MTADKVWRAMFHALVKRTGGVDAAAAVIEAEMGVCAKSTVSKMCAGHIGVTIGAVVALEDCLQEYPITKRLAERRAAIDARKLDLRELAALSTLASGQAHAALIRACAPDSPGGAALTEDERATVIAEVRAARQVLTDIINAAEAAG